MKAFPVPKGHDILFKSSFLIKLGLARSTRDSSKSSHVKCFVMNARDINTSVVLPAHA